MKRLFGHSLSARLLFWTIAFVMLSEVLIFAPSIARFRVSWFEERLASGHLAGLLVDATPERMVGKELTSMLLDHVGAHVVDLYRDGKNTHMLARLLTQPIAASVDLRRMSFFGLIADAFAVLAQRDNRVLRVIGPSPKDRDVLVEVILDEAPLRMAMIDYAERILALSIVISVITASLVFVSLQIILVGPMRRITESMLAFRDNPENTGAMIGPTRRADEIGTAMRVLADMQEALRASLRQKTRLAALGAAVAKINPAASAGCGVSIACSWGVAPGRLSLPAVLAAKPESATRAPTTRTAPSIKGPRRPQAPPSHAEPSSASTWLQESRD
ncbi:MAG: hypothetical protein EXQ92_14625 [Alphaproteobacteria bacterium]|nr:hypothetical protein [Alphaproteobacteria bacterium]